MYSQPLCWCIAAFEGLAQAGPPPKLNLLRNEMKRLNCIPSLPLTNRRGGFCESQQYCGHSLGANRAPALGTVRQPVRKDQASGKNVSPDLGCWSPWPFIFRRVVARDAFFEIQWGLTVARSSLWSLVPPAPPEHRAISPSEIPTKPLQLTTPVRVDDAIHSLKIWVRG